MDMSASEIDFTDFKSKGQKLTFEAVKRLNGHRGHKIAIRSQYAHGYEGNSAVFKSDV